MPKVSDLGGDIPFSSSFNNDAMMALGRLEAAAEATVSMLDNHSTKINNIETRLNDLSSIINLQNRHDKDIDSIKKTLAELQSSKTWVLGGFAFLVAIGSIITFVLNLIKGLSH